MPLQTQMPDARPVLVVGLVGFHPEQETALEAALAMEQGGAVSWRTGMLSEADAWWINGARAQLLGDGSLRIAAAVPGGRSTRIALADVSRPVAFCEPLACRDLEPAYSFRLGDADSIAAVLRELEARWLRATAARRWLAHRLLAAQAALTQRVYHLALGDRLLAVIDRTGEVGWAPAVTMDHLDQASWLPRPSSAAFIPGSFQRTTMSELMWDYAVRSTGDLLPARYRVKRIHFRRPPKIPAGLIRDEHLLVMRELVVDAASFAELVHRTDLGSQELAQALGALYVTGSITTDERRALRPADSHAPSADGTSTSASLWSSSRVWYGDRSAAPRRDFTVPASLGATRPAP